VIVGLTGQPCYAEVNRWPRAMPQYAVGHLDRLEQITTALCRYPGLYLAGAAYRGVGIPDCIADGTRAAELVVQHVGRNLAKDGAATL
jgi:oxygen-dependent protoporphyrinogen oxidase